MISLQPDEKGIQTAAVALLAGEIIAYPTETVYGLAVNPFSADAVAKLFEVKGRDPASAILLLIANNRQLSETVDQVGPVAKACIQAFWPGPLSMLFTKSPYLPENIASGRTKIGIRHSSCPLACHLCEAFGHAITSTSANLSGAPAARSASEINLPGVYAVLDGGVLPPSPPSTLFDPDTLRILREGAIPAEQVQVVARAALSEKTAK